MTWLGFPGTPLLGLCYLGRFQGLVVGPCGLPVCRKEPGFPRPGRLFLAKRWHFSVRKKVPYLLNYNSHSRQTLVSNRGNRSTFSPAIRFGWDKGHDRRNQIGRNFSSNVTTTPLPRCDGESFSRLHVPTRTAEPSPPPVPLPVPKATPVHTVPARPSQLCLA